MKTSRLVFTFLVLMALSACNLPMKNKATPTKNLVAAAVEQTLTALPTKTALRTLVISLPTAEETKTPSPENTASPVFNPTPTTTGDPVSWLGNPTKLDPLDNPQGFGLEGGYEDSAARIVVSDSAMVMTSFSTVGWKTWRVRPPSISNAYISANFRTLGCSGSDQYGIVFRAPNYDTGFGYYFSITCDGKYGLSRSDSNGSATLVNPTLESGILQGPGQSNRLGAMLKGNQITLYINGKVVKELEDNSLSSGFWGAFIGGFSGNFTVQMEDIAYWLQP